MAERSPKGLGRRSRLWLMGALAFAVLGGLGYYFASVATQPSLVSGEGADLATPQELEAEQTEGDGGGQ
jgi:hypothetical protein